MIHKIYILLSVIVLMFTSTFCLNSNYCIKESPDHFFADRFTTTGQSTYQVDSMLLGSNDLLELYIDRDEYQASYNSIGTDILNEFSKNTFAPQLHSTFGMPSDIDNNSVTTVLMLDIDDHALKSPESGAFIGGYFSSINLLNNEEVSQATQGASCSNEQDLLYMDIEEIPIASKAFYSTLAHEYQHLLHYNRDTNSGNMVESTWVNEGLSELASDLVGHGPQTSRLTTLFNSGNGVAYQDTDYPFIYWGTTRQIPTSDTTTAILAYYSYSYLFFRFVYDAYGKGAISKIFEHDAINVPGVDLALQAYSQTTGNTAITSHGSCDTDASTYDYFDCTYRYMWSAILDNPVSIDSSSLNFNSSTNPLGSIDIPLALGSQNTTGTPNYPYTHRFRASTGGGPNIHNISNIGNSRYVTYNNDTSAFTINALTEHEDNTASSFDEHHDNGACAHERFYPLTNKIKRNAL